MKKFFKELWKRFIKLFRTKEELTEYHREEGLSYEIRHARYLRRLEMLEKSARLEGME